MTAEYRITFQIQRRRDEDDDFVEIGFGSSHAWDSITEAEHDIGSAIDNYEWENGPGQPTSEEIKEESR